MYSDNRNEICNNSMKRMVFLDVMPCTFIDTYQPLDDSAASTFRVEYVGGRFLRSVFPIVHSTWRHNTVDCNLDVRRREVEDSTTGPGWGLEEAVSGYEGCEYIE
jgi:hypothetical protein